MQKPIQKKILGIGTQKRLGDDNHNNSYLLGSKTPAFLKTSATMGTVELTGLAMTKMWALGQCLFKWSRKRKIEVNCWPDQMKTKKVISRYEKKDRDILSAGGGEVANDGGVGVEEIITGHAGLAGDTSGDDNDIATGKSLLEAVVVGNVARDLFVVVDDRGG